MKQLSILFLIMTTGLAFGQESLSKEKLYEAKKQLRIGNKAYKKGDFENAGIAYQKSITQNPSYYKGAYNLGNTYFSQKKYKEAAVQYQFANKLAKTKADKAKTSELIGDSFKNQKQLEKALEAYKQALLKNPKDDILRQKYIAAKQEKQKQDQQNKNKKDDKNKDKNKENKDNKGDNKSNKDNKGDKDSDKKENNQQKDQQDKNKDSEQKKQDDKKDNKKQEQQKAQQKSKLSPQQIQQLLESMSNEEQKTQKKVNAQKVKAKANKNEKDW